MSQHASRVSFAEKVYALSKVIHIVKFRNNVAATYNDHQRKHLRLLDDIALLLVIEATSDVAAVAFERCPTEVIFYYAKNRPSTAADRKHILDLIKGTEGQGTAHERLKVVLSKVLVTCRLKTNSRLRKLKKAITNAPAGSRYRGDDRCTSVSRNGSETGTRHFPRLPDSWTIPCPTWIHLSSATASLKSCESLSR